MFLALSSVSIFTLWKNRLFLKECMEGRYWGGTLVIVVICALLLVAMIAFLWRRKFSESGSVGLIMAAFSLALVAVIPIKCQVLNVPPVQKSWEDCVQILLDSAPPEQLSVWTGYGEGGGYFEFHGIPCYLDARAEVFLPAINHKENILHEYVLLRKGLLDYREHLQKYSFTHIFVSSFDPLYEYLLHDSDYVLLYDSDEVTKFYHYVADCSTGIAIKKDATIVDALAQSPDEEQILYWSGKKYENFSGDEDLQGRKIDIVGILQ